MPGITQADRMAWEQGYDWPACSSCNGKGEHTWVYNNEVQGGKCRHCGGSGLDPHPETPGLNRRIESFFTGLHWENFRANDGPRGAPAQVIGGIHDGQRIILWEMEEYASR